MNNNKQPIGNQVMIERINWKQAFPFVHLFRTFRLAIHPSKLAFALAAVLICYMGGRIMDWFSGKQVVVEKPYYTLRLPADEIQKFISSTTIVDFNSWRRQTIIRNKETLKKAVEQYLDKTEEQAGELVRKGQALDALFDKLELMQDKGLSILEERYKQTKKLIKSQYKQKKKHAKGSSKQALAKEYEQSLKQLEDGRDFLRISMLKSSRVAKLVLPMNIEQAIRIVVVANPAAKDKIKEERSVNSDRQKLIETIALADTCEQLQQLSGLGIFQASLSYGILMFNSAVDSVLSAKLFFNEEFKSFDQTPGVPPGLVRTLGLTFAGLAWFVRVHYIYFIIYTLFCIAVWAIAGGAICRIAALHATRDEKIPVKEAFMFAKQKFEGFFSAPLMPIAFIIGCCIVLMIIGLIGAVPFIGEIVVGATFIIPLAIGFVLALIIVGAIGGLGLMYPTIAIEGSDAFDAFSRCYSYVYARPWKTIFYTLVAAVYGTLCFIFVKLFIALVFNATSAITGITMNLDAASYAAPLGKLQAIWFSPTFSGPFFGRFYMFPLSASEALGGFFIAIWVFLLVGLVIAFAISFFFCGYTLIYLLLRKDVDATEIDEVYVEDFEPMPKLEVDGQSAEQSKLQEQNPDEEEASDAIKKADKSEDSSQSEQAKSDTSEQAANDTESALAGTASKSEDKGEGHITSEQAAAEQAKTTSEQTESEQAASSQTTFGQMQSESEQTESESSASEQSESGQATYEQIQTTSEQTESGQAADEQEQAESQMTTDESAETKQSESQQDSGQTQEDKDSKDKD